jgi:hypothetical protein
VGLRGVFAEALAFAFIAFFFSLADEAMVRQI